MKETGVGRVLGKPLACGPQAMCAVRTNRQDFVAFATARGLRDNVKVMIGGAPVTAEYAKQIGADGYSVNASVAVTVAKQMIGLEAA